MVFLCLSCMLDFKIRYFSNFKDKKVISVFNELWTQRATVITSLERYVHWDNTGMTIIQINNDVLIGFEAGLTGRNYYLIS